MAIVERRCPLLLCPLDSENTPKIDELSTTLEKGTESEKIEALKKIIHCIISGINMTRLTMQIIKFCLRSKSHEIKKLLQIYWEVLDKKDSLTGKLKPEMILVCNHLLNDLKHPNEYIRGSTLRLLCRITESEILEQLIPQILINLEHRHSYVRKNAVLAILSILSSNHDLIPDASKRIYQFLLNETNIICRKNAFLCLTSTDIRSALDFFLNEIKDKITTFSESMLLIILELIRSVCRKLRVPKSIFIKCTVKLLDSSSNSVIYCAANTLLSLTPLDSAINRALESYTKLLQSESDQNVKLIVINRLNSLKTRYKRNLRHIIMDILRGLTTPNIDIRNNILTLVLDLASPQNISDIIICLKKEIIQINNNISDDTTHDNIRLNIEYRNMLVDTIHQCAVKFPSVAKDVVHLLMNYLGDESYNINISGSGSGGQHIHNIDLAPPPPPSNILGDKTDKDKDDKLDDITNAQNAAIKDNNDNNKNKTHHSAAYDVILFVKEIVEEYPKLRESILDKLCDSFNDIKSEQVYRCSLWIFGEYCCNKKMIINIIKKICECVGKLPLCDDDDDDDKDNDDDNKKDMDDKQPTSHYLTRTVVLPDGTYAQSTMAVSNKLERDLDLNDGNIRDKYYLRNLLKNGEYYLAGVLSFTLLKLIIKYKNMDNNNNSNTLNKLNAKSLLIITSILRYGTSNNSKNKIDNDTKDRMLYIINKLLNIKSISVAETEILLNKCRLNFGAMLLKKRTKELIKKKEKEKKERENYDIIEYDKLLSIRQLRGIEFNEFDESDRNNILRAAGNRVVDDDNNNPSLKTRLSRIHQLTGFSDPIYAEAAVIVHQFDIVLDFLIINNTNKTLQNLILELHTSGDLKLIDKPNKFNLGPSQSSRIEASIKVSSTENGVIFGNICYSSTGHNISDNNIVVMNCIHMDIMDYVHPNYCSDKQFRDMWVEFEWENKVSVNTDIVNLLQYIKHIANITNMLLLTPIDDTPTTGKQCQFLAANLHAKSIFGEHALMNVSIELKKDDDNTTTQAIAINNNNNDGPKVKIQKVKISGHIRIRCKSQGIALSLGEKITNGQRGTKKNTK